MAHLQKALIDSLKSLGETSPYRKQVGEIVKSLEKEGIVIPSSDYENVINFVLVVMNNMPGILDNNPNDKMLKDLCIYCIYCLNWNAELQAMSYRKNP